MGGLFRLAKKCLPNSMKRTIKRMLGIPEHIALGENPNKRFCGIPWTNMWVEHDYDKSLSMVQAGDVQICCWCTVVDGSANCGNVANAGSLDELWNSKKAKKFRKSILDGSFKYCLKNVCEYYKGVQLARDATDPKFLRIIEQREETAPMPDCIDLNYDKSCNLRCPQCRNDFIIAKGEQFNRLKMIHDRMIGMLDNPKRLAITSGGDCFASRIYLEFLQNFDEGKFRDTKITLRTNGLLFKRYWQSIKKAHSHIDEIMLSVDAATKETYGSVRNPGDFDLLKDNLEYIKSVKEHHGFRYFMPFCVQKRNYGEMGDFVDFVKLYGADHVIFDFLAPNGTLVGEIYREHAVHLQEHPENERFVELLKSDARLHDPSIIMNASMRKVIENHG